MTEYNKLAMSNEDNLDEALALLATGMPLETVLAEAGEDAETLRPLLQMAAETQTLRAIPVPPPGASLQKMLAYAETLSAGGPAVPPAKTGWLARLAGPFRMGRQPIALAGVRMAALTAMVMFVFLAGTVLGGSITLAAQDSLPGQRLYGLKRLSETIRLGLAWTESSRMQLQDIYNQRRWMETNLLLNQGQQTGVTFDANIRSLDGSTLELDGLVIQITVDTVVKGELTPGARVQLVGITQPPNTLVALTLTVIEPAPAIPTSTPTATPTVTPTPTSSPTMTSTPTPTLAMSQGNDTLPLPTPTPMLSNQSNLDRNESGNGTHENDDSSNSNNDGDNSNEDDSNDNDNFDDGTNSNDDSNNNVDDDSNENGDDNKDNSGSGSDSDNSGHGNSEDRGDDDKDDDK